MTNDIFKSLRSTSPSFRCWSQVLRLIYNNDVIWNFIAELSREARVGALWVRECGKLPIREMLAATNVKWRWAAVNKKRTRKFRTFQSIKCVTKKFLEVSRCSRAKQRQRNVQKSVLHVQSYFLWYIDLLLFFTVLRRCLRRLALHDFIFCFNNI